MKDNVGRIIAFENVLNGNKEFSLVAFCKHGLILVTVAHWRAMTLIRGFKFGCFESWKIRSNLGT